MPIFVTKLPEQTLPLGPIELIVLTWVERCKPKQRFFTDRSTMVVLDLPLNTVLRGGDVIYNTEEQTVIVKCAAEDVLVFSPTNTTQMFLVAYTMGTRRRQIQLRDDGTLVTLSDKEVEELLTHLGIKFHRSRMAFEPNISGLDFRP